MSAVDAQRLHERIDPEPRKPIVLPEAEAIQALRDQLEAARERVRDGATFRKPDGDEYRFETNRLALNAGQLVSALDEAERSLFRVLSVAANYNHCFAARHVLDVNLKDLTPEQTEAGFALIAATVGAVDPEGAVALKAVNPGGACAPSGEGA